MKRSERFTEIKRKQKLTYKLLGVMTLLGSIGIALLIYSLGLPHEIGKWYILCGGVLAAVSAILTFPMMQIHTDISFDMLSLKWVDDSDNQGADKQ